MRLRPHLSSHHLASVGAMASYARNFELRIWAVCETCGQRREIDLQTLNERMPWGYTLINRRCRCKLTAGCEGWNVFEYRDGGEKCPVLPLYDLKAQARWAGATLPEWRTV